jgi:hypothetical protein
MPKTRKARSSNNFKKLIERNFKAVSASNRNLLANYASRIRSGNSASFSYMRNIKPHLKGMSDNDFDELLGQNAMEEPVLVNEPAHVNLPPNNHHNDPVEEVVLAPAPAPAPVPSVAERTPHQIFMNKFGKKAGHNEATRNKPKARPWVATQRKSKRKTNRKRR